MVLEDEKLFNKAREDQPPPEDRNEKGDRPF
jgi:hypothetical protein